MSTITQTITSIAPAANPATMDRVTFSTTAAANVLAISNMTTELNTWAGQANALTTSLNAIAAGTAIGIPYTFSTTTTDADPGAGFLRLDNATQNAATTIRADLSGNDTSVWTDVLNTLADSTSAVKGHVRLVKNGDATKWLLFTVSALASPAGYRNITVVPVASSSANPFANTENIVFEFTRTGDKGDTGATGVGITAQAVGWTATAGTTPKTLTQDVDLTASNVSTLNGTQTFITGLKKFTNSLLALIGSSTGYTTFTSANASASNYVITFPAVTSTMAGLQINQTFTKTQSATVTALTSSAASIAVDLSLSNNFSHTMTENTTLAAPSGGVAGTSGQIVFTQHASAAKTLAFNAAWIPVTGTAGVISTTVSAVNVMSYYVVDSTHVWYSWNTAGVA